MSSEPDCAAITMDTVDVKNKNIDIKTSDEHEKHKFIFEKDLSKTDK